MVLYGPDAVVAPLRGKFGERVFHPGDSFDPPGVAVEILLVPVRGPWMKLSEAAQFVDAVKPRRAVAIHEALLSRIGMDLAERILGQAASMPVEFLPQGGNCSGRARRTEWARATRPWRR